MIAEETNVFKALLSSFIKFAKVFNLLVKLRDPFFSVNFSYKAYLFIDLFISLVPYFLLLGSQ